MDQVFNDNEALLLGVCAGIANWLKIDAAIVRVVTVVFVLFAPAVTIAAYLLAWLIFFRKPKL